MSNATRDFGKYIKITDDERAMIRSVAEAEGISDTEAIVRGVRLLGVLRAAGKRLVRIELPEPPNQAAAGGGDAARQGD